MRSASIVTAGVCERLFWDAFQCWRENKAGGGCLWRPEVGFTERSCEPPP